MSNSYARDIAQTIISQLGGNRISVMIGVKNMTYQTIDAQLLDEVPHLYPGKEGDVYLTIQYTAKAKKISGKSPNVLRVVYNEQDDLYSMVHFRVRAGKVTFLKKDEHVFCDQLVPLFEDTTGLYLSI